MTGLHLEQYDPKIYRMALGNLLKLKDYHVAAPTRKNKMLMEEYARILREEEPFYGKKREKRGSERIPINLKARFLYRRKLYKGIVTNLSKKGMSIETRKCLPLKSKIEILINKCGVKVPVRVSRIIEKDDVCSGMGIELVKQPAKYIKFVDRSRP
jgi:hypothetical protein